jgi:hypothetical protein
MEGLNLMSRPFRLRVVLSLAVGGALAGPLGGCVAYPAYPGYGYGYGYPGPYYAAPYYGGGYFGYGGGYYGGWRR